MENIENILLEGLKSKPDFSISFTQKVETIKNKLEVRLNAYNLIRHDVDMNYSSSQCLEIYTDRNINLVKQIDAVFLLKVFVSSRCPLYSYLFYRKENHNTWKFAQNLNGFEELLTKINIFMEKHNFTLFPYKYKSVVVNGFKTELDNRPATYFEILFSEIV